MKEIVKIESKCKVLLLKTIISITIQLTTVEQEQQHKVPFKKDQRVQQVVITIEFDLK